MQHPHARPELPLVVHVILLAVALVLFLSGTFYPGSVRRRFAAHLQCLLLSSFLAGIYGSPWFNVAVVAWGLMAGGFSVLLGLALLRRLGIV